MLFGLAQGHATFPSTFRRSASAVQSVAGGYDVQQRVLERRQLRSRKVRGVPRLELAQHPEQFRGLRVGTQAQHLHHAAPGQQGLGNGDIGACQPADRREVVEEGAKNPAFGVRHPPQQLGSSAPVIPDHQPVLDALEHIVAAKLGRSAALRIGRCRLVPDRSVDQPRPLGRRELVGTAPHLRQQCARQQIGPFRVPQAAGDHHGEVVQAALDGGRTLRCPSHGRTPSPAARRRCRPGARCQGSRPACH